MIPGLDGLRAIAFLLVLALHTDYSQVGWIGVQFFFVLSGFLITGILLDMKKSLPPRQYFFKFYGRRFLRIFPLYYFYLLLMAGVTIWLISISYRPNYMKIFLEQIRYAVLYVCDFFFATDFFKHSNFLDHFWSLSVEEQFYIFWPLLNYFFAVTVYAVARERLFLRFLDAKLMQYLGKISYGLYVYHFPVVWFAGRIRDFGLPEPAAKVLTALIAFMATLLTASASYHWLEKPLLNLKDRLFSLKESKKQKPVTVIAAE